MTKLKIGIIGHGFVGKAVDFGFTNNKVEKYIVDPNHNTTVDSMYNEMSPDIVFVAVPTPMGEDGQIDSSIIEGVFKDLARFKLKHKPIAVVKSTITPAIVKKLEKIYNRITFNPEFLTERNANQDFIEAPLLVIGGEDQHDLMYIKDVYDKYSNCRQCPTYLVDLETAAMVKYTLNSFLATKVLFFNKLKDIYDKSGAETSWDLFTSIIASDPRIGESHMQVPGPDGRLGYGGACFPKDTTALLKYSKDIGADFGLLQKVIQDNQEIRSSYKDLDAREKEQNVKFNVL